MATAQDIISKAKSYLGTREYPPGSNNVIFNTHYYGGQVSGSAYPWCCAFVWDIFRMAGASSLFMDGGKTAYCQTVWNWYKARGKTGQTARPGAIVIYNWDGYGDADHIGIAERAVPGGCVAIEGNTSVTSDDDGGNVMRRERYRGIVGYCYPDYDGSSSDPVQSDGILRYGSQGAAVKAMQAMLIAVGYSCGIYGADGDFGKGTDGALIAFQRRHGLEADGEYGPLSKAKLEAVYAAKQAGTGSIYVVQPGDTLSQIAADHGTTVDELVQLNKIQNPNLIILGQKIKLAAAKQVGKCTGDCVNVRSGPGTSYGVLRMLNKGNLFDILGYSGAWVKVNVTGTVGYMHGDYVAKV